MGIGCETESASIGNKYCLGFRVGKLAFIDVRLCIFLTSLPKWLTCAIPNYTTAKQLEVEPEFRLKIEPIVRGEKCT